MASLPRSASAQKEVVPKHITPETLRAVAKGLDFLAAKQSGLAYRPVLVTVTVCGAVVAPRFWLPKVRLLGVTEAPGWPLNVGAPCRGSFRAS